MWPTDYPTDQAMDWLTNRVIYRVLCTQLKKRTLGVDGALVGVEEDDDGRGDREEDNGRGGRGVGETEDGDGRGGAGVTGRGGRGRRNFGICIIGGVFNEY